MYGEWPRSSARGGGRGPRAGAPMGAQGPHVGLGLALLGAVVVFRRGAGRDENPLAACRGADPEPLRARLADQPGQPGDGARRVPVRGRSALHQVDMPVLTVVTDDLLVYRRSEEHTSELQSQFHLVCRLL